MGRVNIYNKIAVLLGGVSSEREISLMSGKAVSKGLEEAGYEVCQVDVGFDLDIRLREIKPDAVFIALHGKFGEDGLVQGLLEMMRIPYTGSSPIASAVAMDKAMTCSLLEQRGITIPPGFLLKASQSSEIPASFSFPLVVKPSTEGSSVGVSIVNNHEEYKQALLKAFSFCDEILVESFILGTEINVAILEGEILGSVEIETNNTFYDYEAKYSQGGSIHHIPPRLDKKLIEKAAQIALKAYKIIGCSGAARVDLIISKNNEPFVLEINNIPGMTQTSLLPEIASWAGISFSQLVSKIIQGARLHYKN
jgi:D-alanine-D-alanine ligase